MMSSNVRAPGKNAPVLGQELRRVRVAATDPLADQLVEVAHHLAVGGEVLRAHRPDRLGHPLDELIEDLALEPLDELIEALARVRLEEVVVLQAADPLPDVRGEAVELVEPFGRRRRGASTAGRRASRRRRVRDASSSRRSTPGPLLGDDLVELAPDVAEHVVELVALEHLLAPALEPIDQVAQAGHVAARRVAGPPAALHQPAERLGEVALGHDVVGERAQDLVGVEVGDLLAAVPGRVACRPGERVRAGGRAASERRPGPLRLRPQIAWIRGVGGHRW